MNVHVVDHAMGGLPVVLILGGVAAVIVLGLIVGYVWYRHTNRRQTTHQTAALPDPPTPATTNPAFQMDDSRPPPTAPAFIANPTYSSIDRPEGNAPNVYTSIYPSPVAFPVAGQKS